LTAECFEFVPAACEIVDHHLVLGCQGLDLVGAVRWASARDVLQSVAFVCECADLAVDGVPVDAGVEREVLGVADGQGLGERVERFGLRGLGSVGFFSGFAADEVDAVLGAPAGEGDVAGFLVEQVGAEDEGAVDGAVDGWPWALWIVVA